MNQFTLLLVEDNTENMALMMDYLVSKGYHLVTAWNGHEAITQAQRCRPDIILMDIQMPQMDGIEAMRRIRADASFNNVPIIAITALAMQGDRERCLAAGANAYLSKPVSLRELATLLATYLAATTPLKALSR